MRWFKAFVCICVVIGLTAEWFGEAVLLTTRQGIVRGTTMRANNGKLYNAFLGIPYAQPPVGKLRFKPPVKASPWKGVLNATVTPSPCVQSPLGIVIGQEDCLTLTVYTPLNSKPGDNIPVLFYIFGGMFLKGSNSHLGPLFIMNHDVILIMPNYRLGALGFLSTGDTVISGNMALKDQLLAMKWAKENVYAFGGDQNRITIHGHSSGAMCVHMHTLSPQSNGLFNRVIMQSGTSYNCFFDKGVARSFAQEYARQIGCEGVSSQEMYRCFMNLPAETLVSKQSALNIWDGKPDGAFRPSNEDENAEQPFLTNVTYRSPYQTSKAEWLIGVTSAEGSIYTPDLFANGSQLLKKFDPLYKLLFPMAFQYMWSATARSQNFISESLRKRYFEDNNFDENSRSAITQLYSQSIFVFPANKAIHGYKGTKYVYLFDYISGFTVANSENSYDSVYDVRHADELPLFFFTPEKNQYLNEFDRIFGDEMITRWINFVYSGNPNEPFSINETLFRPWTPVRSEQIEFLRIKVNGSMERNFYTDEYKYWKQLPLFSKYYS